jgi:hypothetical protein
MDTKRHEKIGLKKSRSGARVAMHFRVPKVRVHSCTLVVKNLVNHEWTELKKVSADW